MLLISCTSILVHSKMMIQLMMDKYTGKAVVLKSDEKSSAQNVEVTFELDSADTKLELYVFDSRNNMNILYPGVIYQLTEQ